MAPTPVAKRVHITSGAQWTRNCAGRWRPCVEEMTRWSNDPPLSAEHAIVQLDSRFPKAINLWASQGWSRITSRNSLTHGNKLAGRRTVPVFGAACDFQVVPGPRPGIATWRSKHETEAQGYIKMWQKGMPPCRRSVKRTPPSLWPSTRPHGGQGCSHLHAATGARWHGHQISADPVQRRENHQRQ